MFTTAGAVLDTLKTLVEADATFTGVSVFTAPTDLSQPSEYLVLGHTVTASGEQETMGKAAAIRADLYQLESSVVVFKTAGTSHEATAVAARDRALELLSAFKDVVVADPRLGGIDGAQDVWVQPSTSWEMEQGAADRSRFCAVTFRIDVEARLA